MKIKLLFTTLLLLTASLIYAQVQHESDTVALTNVKEIAAPGIDTTIYNNVEKMPTFPGGEFKMYEFLAMNIRYPQRAREDGYSGTVYVRFVVEPDGTITNIEVAKGVGGGCSEEAVRVVKMMPNWIPGEAFGKKVRVTYTLPINFRLQ